MIDETVQADDSGGADDYSAGWDAADTAIQSEQQSPVEAPGNEAQAADTKAEPGDADREEPTQKEKAPAEPVQANPWEGLNDEQRSSVDRMREAFKSEQNRAVGQQNRADALAAQVKAMEARLAEAEKSSPVAKPDPNLPDNLDDSFPELAAEIRSLRATNAELQQQMENRLAPVESVSRSIALSANEDALTKAHSDWREVIAKPDFGQMIAEAPEPVQQAAYQNSESITNPGNAAFVLQWYKEHAVAPAATTANRSTQSGAMSLDAQRKQKLEAAQAPSIRDNTVSREASTPLDDYEAGWMEADKEIRRNAKRI